MKHNHFTRDVKPPGVCPACDAGRHEAQPLMGLFGAAAAECMRDHGRFTVGGHDYLVVLPPGQKPGDPVWLERDDGKMFAVDLRADVREITEAAREAGM